MTPVKRLRDAAMWRINGIHSMARSVWRMRAWDRMQRVPISFPDPDPDRVPVIFCTWHRIERLPQTLAMLAEQTVPVQAVIWDNNGQSEAVAKAVADSPVPVTIHHSERNIGGFGRFYLARAAAEAAHQAVVFVDDDAEFGPTLVADMLNAHRPRSLSGWFAFTEPDPRLDVWAAPGEPAVYLGTCGMIADPEIFTRPGLFACPRRYWFIEDVWLSSFAARHGYALFRSPINLTELQDGRNQSLTLGWTRKRLWKYLESTPKEEGVATRP